MVDIQFDLNAKLEEIRAINASKDEKRALSNMAVSAYSNAYMDAADKKEETKNDHATWEDADIITALSGIKKAHGEKSTWEYGLFKTDAYLSTVSDIAKELNRTEGAIHTLLKISTIGGNISKAKQKKGAINSAVRFKKLAQSVGLITEKAFVSALYNGYTVDALNLEAFASHINIHADNVTPSIPTVSDEKEPVKETVKVTIKKKDMSNRKVGARYTYEERISIFKKVVAKIGNFKAIERTYGTTSFSGFPPIELTQEYVNIASNVPNRTTSAIKNTVDHAVSVARHPNRKYTKSRTEMYDAAIEAGFIV